MLKIGFSGTQLGMNLTQLNLVEEVLIEELPIANIQAHHGMCIGADEQFHDICIRYHIDIIGHPPINKSKMMQSIEGFKEIREPKEYLVRNHDIVDESSILIAAPKEVIEVLRSGTWATIRYAEKMGHMTRIILP